MTNGTAPSKFLTTISLALWAVVIFLPLVVFLSQALSPVGELELTSRIVPAALRSVALAAIIAAAAVLLAWIPGRLLGTSRRGGDVLLFLLLMPLVLPRYVLYYAWILLMSPTTKLGAFLSGKPELARFVGTFTSSMVLILWYWPLAGLLIAQGWRSIDRRVWDSASLDASRVQMFRNITLPLLVRPLILAFGVCFVLALSEFATFHLAGVETIGTELAVMYEETGSESRLARAAWPVVAIAVVVAIAIGKGSRTWGPNAAVVEVAEMQSSKWQWIFLIFLLGVSLIAPVAILIGNMADTKALRQFFMLHSDDLTWSFGIAAGAALIAYLIAHGALSLETTGRREIGRFRRLLSVLVRTTVLVVMFVPASLIAVSLIKMLTICNAPMAVRQGWYIVSAGQACRFAGVALILLLLTRSGHRRVLSEIASLDGATRFKAALHVHLPHTWPLFIGTFLLVLMFSITELSATMVLLPAGLPNFAQRLLNQMHYARDQQVIASCLVLVCLFLVLAACIVLLLRAMRTRRITLFMIFGTCLISLAGCSGKSEPPEETKVLSAFGETGRGQGQFIHPRAIDIAENGTLFIVDKTGRIQKFGPKGDYLATIEMPQIELGKPTGLSVAPNGNLYVADTHYHRIMIFSPEDEIIDQFGKFGEDEGCFIYPTDVAFAGDGRIFVSEYGGNDRVSVFTEEGEFLFCFGSLGSGREQFSRPSAVCIDQSRKRLYVADACNHRIAMYDLDGELMGYIGSVGRGPGQLRYPYDLALLADGTLVVCEYGNNRVQLFDPKGRSLAVYGQPGRRLGELACPWGVAVDEKRRAFIADRDNMRIQVWQL